MREEEEHLVLKFDELFAQFGHLLGLGFEFGVETRLDGGQRRRRRRRRRRSGDQHGAVALLDVREADEGQVPTRHPARPASAFRKSCSIDSVPISEQNSSREGHDRFDRSWPIKIYIGSTELGES